MSSSQFVKNIIGKQKKPVETMGPYLSKNEDWKFSVARVMLTGILNNQYYRSADNAAQEALPLLVKAAKTDPEYLLKAAAFARDANMKGFVKVGIVALAASAPETFLSDVQNTRYIIALLATFHPGQLIQFVEMCRKKVCGKGLGSRPQKWVRAVMEGWSAERVEEYTLKYPKALHDLVRLIHPRFTDERGGLVKYVLTGNKEVTGVKQGVVEQLKRSGTPEIIAKKMLDYNIPWDVIKGFAGMKDPLPLAMMTQMGLTALLLNIRSLEEHGAFNTSDGLTALKMKLDEVKFGRSIPLDFAKPYLYSNNSRVKNLLLDAIVATLDSDSSVWNALEGKRVGVSVDISGSMSGDTLKTAGLLAVPFIRANNLWFTTFNTYLYEEGPSGKRSFWNAGLSERLCPKINGLSRKQQVENLLNMRTAGGTDVAISIREAIRTRRKLDLHIIITDERQNTGTPLMTAWRQYKASVNSNAELWIINATNYQWHAADFDDPSVTVYQAMTPAIFKNVEYCGMDLVSAVCDYNLGKLIRENQPKFEKNPSVGIRKPKLVAKKKTIKKINKKKLLNKSGIKK